MPATVETLEAEALQLTRDARARLIERLIASLDIDPDAEDAWAVEAEHRQEQIESGAASLVPGPETMAKLKSEFQVTSSLHPEPIQKASR